jgi:hypothetical protein
MEADDRQNPPRHLYAQHLLGAAANLSGTCLAGAALIRVEQTQSGRNLITDNVLAVSALFFLAATGLAYLALRRRSTRIHIATEIAFSLGAILLAIGLFSLALDLAWG